MSKRVAALLLTVALLFTAALAQEDTMDWTDYEAVLAYVTREAPMELHLGETKFSLEQLRALKEALPGSTKLIIAQRISSVMDADVILVLDDGKISGMGTHEQLMASNQIYREVYQSQQEGVSIDG